MAHFRLILKNICGYHAVIWFFRNWTETKYQKWPRGIKVHRGSDQFFNFFKYI